MKTTIRISYLLLMLLLLQGPGTNLQAQGANTTIIQGQVTSSSDKLEIIGANVSEIDDNNRVVNGTVTDFNGKYVMRIKS